MGSEKTSPSPRGMRRLFRALRHRNYRLFFGGQGISLIGTWMQQIAISWLVYRLTNSPLILGVVSFSGQIPSFLLAPIAGVLADRWDRRSVLVATQILSMVQAFTLAFLTLTRVITVSQIVGVSVLLGLVNALDIPARQSFVVEMVERREDLGNAIALNSSMFNGARLVGPSVAGILIATVGEGMCFLLNGLSYVAVIAALLAMRITPRRIETARPHVLRGLKEGVRYAFGFAPIKWILLLAGMINLVGMPFTVLMPVLARDVLHGGPGTLGILMAAMGVGALAGAMYLAGRESVRGLGRTIAIASGVFGTGLIALSLSRTLWLSLAVMVVTGFGMIVQMASSNTILQTLVDEDKRGRVMSLYAMAFVGMAPLGSLLGGALASRIGAPATIAIGGASCIAGSVGFAAKLPSLREVARPTYVRLGILPGKDAGARPSVESGAPADD
jgi:MFS family permease